jgi:hypothetical protein
MRQVYRPAARRLAGVSNGQHIDRLDFNAQLRWIATVQLKLKFELTASERSGRSGVGQLGVHWSHRHQPLAFQLAARQFAPFLIERFGPVSALWDRAVAPCSAVGVVRSTSSCSIAVHQLSVPPSPLNGPTSSGVIQPP